MEALFLAKLPDNCRASLMDSATKHFAEHWTGAVGFKFPSTAHDSLDLSARTCTEWQEKASEVYAANLQTHIFSLESGLLTRRNSR